MRSILLEMRSWAVFAVLAGLCVATPAAAQKAREEPAIVEAKQRFNEGIKFADEGNHEAARLKFSQAWMLLKSPAILFNLARSEQLSGHPIEALEHFRLFAKMGSDPKVTEQQKDRAKEFIAELTNKVGQIEVDAAPNSQITIDGKATEWTPQSDPVPVMPGSHQVVATLEGRAANVTVEATAGTVVRAKLRDVASPTTAPAAPSPATAATPPPTEEHHTSWSAGRITGLAIAGGGVVALGLGFYFHLDSTNAGDDADAKIAKNNFGTSGCKSPAAALASECKAIGDDRDQEDRSAAIRNGLWIGGGALLVGGAALFLLSAKGGTEKPRAWQVLPSITPKNGGLAFVGTF